MIRFITGNPGGGKGLYGMRVIVEELAHGTRPIFTNLPIKLDELNAYMQEKFPNVDARTVQRVRILTDEEVPGFYRHRPDGTVETDGDKLKFLECREGVFYLVDEAQNFFNSRAWAKTGPHALFYLSQHRKLGDDVWLCTQHPANVDKQFRSVAQDYVHLRNLANEKRGVFRMPRLFTWAQTLEPKGPNVRAVASGTFTLDVEGLGSCYSTAAGVGVPGTGQADKGKQHRGVHWAVVPIGFVSVLVAFWWLANHGAGKLIPMLLGSGPAKPVQAAPKAVVPDRSPGEAVNPAREPAAVPVRPQDSPKRSIPAPGPAVQAGSVEDPGGADLVGYSSAAGMVRVYLSDGSDWQVHKGQFLPIQGGCAIRERAGWIEYRFPRRKRDATVPAVTAANVP